jgi:hypothetical protein
MPRNRLSCRVHELIRVSTSFIDMAIDNSFLLVGEVIFRRFGPGGLLFRWITETRMRPGRSFASPMLSD